MFKTCIKKWLNNFCNVLKLIPNFQFSFNEKYSTVRQPARLSEYIVHGFENKKHTVVVFLDLEKALYKVWHHELKHKLKSSGVKIYFQHPLFISIEQNLL